MKTSDNDHDVGDFLTVNDWAARVKLSRRTVFRQIDEGIIPPFDFSVGKIRRWHRTTYERWVEEQLKRN